MLGDFWWTEAPNFKVILLYLSLPILVRNESRKHSPKRGKRNTPHGSIEKFYMKNWSKSFGTVKNLSRGC